MREEIQQTNETFVFLCQKCKRMWKVEYRARRYRDLDGDVYQLYFRDGQPALPPWNGMSCPHCGDYRVRVSTWTRTAAPPQPPFGVVGDRRGGAE